MQGCKYSRRVSIRLISSTGANPPKHPLPEQFMVVLPWGKMESIPAEFGWMVGYTMYLLPVSHSSDTEAAFTLHGSSSTIPISLLPCCPIWLCIMAVETETNTRNQISSDPNPALIVVIKFRNKHIYLNNYHPSIHKSIFCQPIAVYPNNIDQNKQTSKQTLK